MHSTEDDAKRLGISDEAVEARRQSHELLALQVGAGWQYPAFQIAGDHVRPGLPSVLAQLASYGPSVTLDILIAHDTALGGRNLLEVVQDGDHALVDRVLRQLEGDGFS